MWIPVSEKKFAPNSILKEYSDDFFFQTAINIRVEIFSYDSFGEYSDNFISSVIDFTSDVILQIPWFDLAIFIFASSRSYLSQFYMIYCRLYFELKV
jgi:hypothetical protein